MKTSLINVFRELYKYLCKWKLKQKKEDWIVYILFWIGAIIGHLISIHLEEKSLLVYLSFPLIFGSLGLLVYLSFPLIFGSLAEAIFMIPYIIIKSFFFTDVNDGN